ncbi:MAG: hypothetical protein DRI52_06430 [Chloroflexi bacterium]|nr:MAG: hypothetical protein DRI52_06430 [Chloroflexota bacterium]
MSQQMELNVATVKELAREFSLSEGDLMAQGLRAFILEQLRLLQAEKEARCAKFGVKSLEEMDELIRQGKVAEEDILDDFQNVDYLTARIERLQQLLESYSWPTSSS